MKKERYLMWLFFLVLGAVTMKAQQYQLKGVVHDEVGEAVIGATVIVEGTHFHGCRRTIHTQCEERR